MGPRCCARRYCVAGLFWAGYVVYGVWLTWTCDGCGTDATSTGVGAAHNATSRACNASASAPTTAAAATASATGTAACEETGGCDQGLFEFGRAVATINAVALCMLPGYACFVAVTYAYYVAALKRRDGQFTTSNPFAVRTVNNTEG